IIARKVRGDEEPPLGATAIITPDTTDIVSHVAIRARNARLLFATCFEEEHIRRLVSMEGHSVDLQVTSGGDVAYEESEGKKPAPLMVKAAYPPLAMPCFTSFAVTEREFRPGRVGGKALNLQFLREKAPEGVKIPVSVAIPFCVFEHILSIEINRAPAERYTGLLKELDRDPGILSEIRRTILELKAPEEMRVALKEVFAKAGIPWPDNWEQAWRCITGVWASKWNERAYYSRKSWGLRHQDLFMSVLIQEVVEAEYAFVLHTSNPLSGDRTEIYGEVVIGLGETLVGNYPGRAMGFICRKESPEIRLVSYPSKGECLFGGGLIFRSDSNGEDLIDYAGAGLYDSIMMDPPREVPLDYTEEPLVWDVGFRERLISEVARIGIAIEAGFGSAQDIEGVYAKGQFFVVQSRPQV
ncbi:MAG: hypothetical protein HGA78_09270, partial [Nitrospirales bacterium]|nr:hypothetical protein [Nitrospirales bacterium]